MIESSETGLMITPTERIAELERRVATLGKTLGFFRSVIMGRESWTETCEQHYREALEGGGEVPK